MAELHVSNKNIGTLLSDMQGKKFIIPDYQRPYKWEEEKCETLWKDIIDFFEHEPTNVNYFMGTIVTAIREDGNPQVIDGQQRLTSFFLLLRAFYKTLEGMDDSNDDVLGLKMQLGQCIWDVHPISKRVSDMSTIHIFSEVATEEDNETFHNILMHGIADEKKEDNYSVNYRYFKRSCDAYAMQQPLNWYKLCVTILNRCIILPIECNTEETALTIFSTLNDRGLPLEDSDIFKAQLYKNCTNAEDRKKFNEDWKYIAEVTKEAKISIDDVFRYYTHIIRAKASDKTKEVGLRRFYAQDSYSKLKQEGFVKEIKELVNFWWYINKFENPENYPEENEPYQISSSAFRYIDVLVSYPNDYWKFVTTVFYYKNRNTPDFSVRFEEFLKQLISYLMHKFIDQPSVNAIKDDIYNACILVYKGLPLQFDYAYSQRMLDERINQYASSKISKALLLLYAYLNPKQTDLLETDVQIEHIFPKKWQNTNYNGWDEKDAKIYLDWFGNKIVFEKKLNIQAGNGYFSRKKEKYLHSKVAQVVELGNYPKADWNKEDIEIRNEDFKLKVCEFIKENIPKIVTE